MQVNPMNASIRCSAKAKTTGCRCRGPAVKGHGVCRMHGAKGGAPSGPGNGMWRHGGRSAETALIRQLGTELACLARSVCGDIPRGRLSLPRLQTGPTADLQCQGQQTATGVGVSKSLVRRQDGTDCPAALP